MARPKKQAEHKNNIMLRLTDTQYEIVSEYARLMGLPVAVYAREVVTEGRHPIQCNIVRYDENLNKAIAHLSKIGNNLNQMMRYFHGADCLRPKSKKIYMAVLKLIASKKSSPNSSPLLPPAMAVIKLITLGKMSPRRIQAASSISDFAVACRTR